MKKCIKKTVKNNAGKAAKKPAEKFEVQVLDADVEAACKAAGVKPARKRARVAVIETEPVVEEKPVEPTVEEKPVEKKSLTAEEKRAKRNAYAREYYKNHREKLCEASRLCHARKRAEIKAAKAAAKENA